MSDADEWLLAVTARLGVPEDLVGTCSQPLLDMVRQIAHGVERPAGPLTAFLVGVAVGGLSPEDRPEAVEAHLSAIRDLLHQRATAR